MNKEIILETPIIHDSYTEMALKMYDVPPTTTSVVVIKNNIELPKEDWKIGLIVGPSGAGKTTLLKQFGNVYEPIWDEKPIISNFINTTPEEATKVLCAVGFSSVPSWLRPYHVLSNGEKFRANLARLIIDNKDGLILVDEFTSVVDRNVAKAASFALQKYLKHTKTKIILSSCHNDIIDWLNPDWIYNPLEGITHFPRGLLQRPKISLKIFRAKYEAWDLFKQHHYLTNKLHKSTRLFVASWNDNIVACCAILAMPSGTIKNAWRESRTVVLPDYQGLGIGAYLSDYFGSLIKARGGQFYSRTIHPAMIAHRLKNGKWQETARSRTIIEEKDQQKSLSSWQVDTKRLCYSFKYIGEASTDEESKLFWETTT